MYLLPLIVAELGCAVGQIIDLRRESSRVRCVGREVRPLYDLLKLMLRRKEDPMLALETIRTIIIEGLSAHLGNEVNVTDGTVGNLTGGLVTCDFSDVFHSIRGFPVVMQVGDKLIKTETVHFTMTFLSFEDDKAIRTHNACTAREWFKSEGHVELKEKVNVVVSKVGSVSNRDIQNDTVWERREGVDVEFRTLDILESDLEWIEQTKIQRS